MNKDIILDFIKKQFLLVLILAGIIIYALFFKPNPKVRVDWNKTQVNKSNSTLTIEAPTEISGVGKTFKAKIIVDTHNYYINAAQSYIEFDPRVLQVIKNDTTESFCKFYPENSYSNEKGLIKLACGTPYPGFKGKNTMQTIEFLTKAIKTTDLKVSKQSMVLANDGKGTNLLKDLDTVSIKIKAGI